MNSFKLLYFIPNIKQLRAFILFLALMLPAIRLSAITAVVTNTTDGLGSGSFRWAINQVNAAGGGVHFIDFNIPGAGPHIISLTGSLPVLNKRTELRGHTQPGTTPTSPMIWITGGGTIGYGLVMGPNSKQSKVRGLRIQNFVTGALWLNGSDQTEVSECVFVRSGSGIVLQSVKCIVQKNYIGTDAGLSAALGNTSYGIRVLTPAAPGPAGSSGDNQIGGSGAGNMIAYNGSFGVSVETSFKNFIQQNIFQGNPAAIRLYYGSAIEGNKGKPSPVITGFSATTGLLSGTCETLDEVEIFKGDLSGQNALQYVGSATGTASGTWSFTLAPGSISSTDVYVSTATKKAKGTSELSNILMLGGSYPACGFMETSTWSGSGEEGDREDLPQWSDWRAPWGVAVNYSNDHVYVSDEQSHRIRLIAAPVPAPQPVVTLAGSTAGYTDGTGAAAQFNQPRGMCTDFSGNIYVADFGNNRIRKITPAGVVTTVAGSGAPTSVDGTGVTASFNGPVDVAFFAPNLLYVCEYNGHRIRRINLSTGAVSTVAGSTAGFADGTGPGARFSQPVSIDVFPSGTVAVSDEDNDRIRYVTPGGVVTTNPYGGLLQPNGIQALATGEVIVINAGRYTVERITASGVMEDLAGTPGVTGYINGYNAQYGIVKDLALDKMGGVLYVADQSNHVVRELHCLNLQCDITGQRIIREDAPAELSSYTAFTSSDEFKWTVVTVPPLISPVSSYTMVLEAAPVMYLPGGHEQPDWSSAISLSYTPPALTAGASFSEKIGALIPAGTGPKTWYWRVGLIYEPLSGSHQPVSWSEARRLRYEGEGIEVPAAYLTDGGLHTNNINWVYQVSYSDEETHQRIVYVDGLGNQRQSGALLNSEGTAGEVMTTEVAYSEEGGGAAGTLAAPKGSNQFGYAHRFFDVFDGSNWSDFGTEHYDRAVKGAGYNELMPPVSVDGSMAGSVAHYYGPAGPDVQVDDAGGYPYSYAVAYPEPLARAMLAGGPGTTFKITGGKETEMFYLKPSQTELNRIYGKTNAPSQKNIGQIISMDANGVGTISYIDREGQVIATAMTTCHADSMVALEEDGMAAFTQVITIDNSILDSTTLELSGTSTFFIACDNVDVCLDFGVDVGSFSVGDIWCRDCEYDVELRIVDDATGEEVYAYRDSIMPTPAGLPCSSPPQVIDLLSCETVTLSGPGTYTLSRTLRPHLNTDTGLNVLEEIYADLDSLVIEDRDSLFAEFMWESFGEEKWYLLRQSKDIPYATDLVTDTCMKVETYTGGLPTGYADGTLATARWSRPGGMAFDDFGNMYVVDRLNRRIRKITPAGVVSTVAGTGTAIISDGPLLSASFFNPLDIISGQPGVFYITDNKTIRKMDLTTGIVTSFAEITPVCFGLPVINISGIVYNESTGELFVTIFQCNQVWRITAAGVVSLFAGSPSGAVGSADGTGTAATFRSPWGIVMDAGGNLYVGDRANRTIRRITPAGVVTRVAGTTLVTGSLDASPATIATLGAVQGMEMLPDGRILITEAGNNGVRIFDPVANSVSTLAGSILVSGGPVAGFTNGTTDVATFNNPQYIRAASDGSIYVAEFDNNAIRRIFPDSCGVTCGSAEACAGFELDAAESSDAPDPSFAISVSAGSTLLCSGVGYTSGEVAMATAIVNAINAGTATHGYTASNLGGTSDYINVCGPLSAGASLNGVPLHVSLIPGTTAGYNPEPYIATGVTLFMGGYDLGDCDRYYYYADEVDTMGALTSPYAFTLINADGDADLDGTPGDEKYGLTGVNDLGALNPAVPGDVDIINTFRMAWFKQTWEWLELDSIKMNLLEVTAGSALDPAVVALLKEDKTLDAGDMRGYYLVKAKWLREYCYCEPREFPFDCNTHCEEQLDALEEQRDVARVNLEAHPTLYDSGIIGVADKDLKDLIAFYSMPLPLSILNGLDAVGLDIYFAYEHATQAVANFDKAMCLSLCEGTYSDSCASCGVTWNNCYSDLYTEILSGYNYIMSSWTGTAFPFTLDDIAPLNTATGLREPDATHKSEMGDIVFNFVYSALLSPGGISLAKPDWELLSPGGAGTCPTCYVPAHGACAAGAEKDLESFPVILLPSLITKAGDCGEDYHDCFRQMGTPAEQALYYCEQNLENCVASLGDPLDPFYSDPLSPGYGTYYTSLAACSTSWDCSDPAVVMAVDSASRMLAILSTVNTIYTDPSTVDSIADTLYALILTLTLPELELYLAEWATVERCEVECALALTEMFNEWVETWLNDRKNETRSNFIEMCFGRLNERLKLTYGTSYYHYTLYNYSFANDLTSTIPPDGVDYIDIENPDPLESDRNPEWRQPTEYEYNSIGELSRSKSPEEGEWFYLYDKASRLRYSQNEEQAARSTGGNVVYTYYKYENETPRLFETGEQIGGPYDGFFKTGPGTYVEDYTEDNLWPPPGVLTQHQTTMEYEDEKLTLAGFEQKFLERRLSRSCTEDACTYYSYDAHGRSVFMVQEIYEFGTSPFKTIEYEFEPISSLVTEVFYQKGHNGEDFRQRYSYDSDLRLTTVEISADEGVTYLPAAEYDYYLHGPVKSVAYGGDVQRLNYTFNLQGWLKAINHPLPGLDPGGDGITPGSVFAKDVFAMALHYYNGDYQRSGMGLDASAAVTPKVGDNVKNAGPGLYNGNISGWTTYTGFDQVAATAATTPSLLGQGFRYDVLNRIKYNHAEAQSASAFIAYGGGTLTPGTDDVFTERLTHDPNGNIEQMVRTAGYRTFTAVGGGIFTSTAMDNMTYGYKTAPDHFGNPKKITNKLYHINDAAPKDPGLDDIADQGVWSPSVNDNYVYDGKGRLIRDVKEDIDNISWNIYNKIETITRTAGSGKTALAFGYGSTQDRVWKRATSGPLPADTKTTLYVRDGSGNVLAVYEREILPTSFTPTLTLTEHHIYGSKRIGMYVPDNALTGPVPAPLPVAVKADLRFELTDHLGNVRAVVSGAKLTGGNADILSLSDYYPFGMPLPGRTYTSDKYRYGYNGKESDDELKGEGMSYDYGFRMYDPRIARFMSFDPLAASYPELTPYQYASNCPVVNIDYMGLGSVPQTSSSPSTLENGGIQVSGPASGPDVYESNSSVIFGITYEAGAQEQVHKSVESEYTLYGGDYGSGDFPSEERKLITTALGDFRLLNPVSLKYTTPDRDFDGSNFLWIGDSHGEFGFKLILGQPEMLRDEIYEYTANRGAGYTLNYEILKELQGAFNLSLPGESGAEVGMGGSSGESVGQGITQYQESAITVSIRTVAYRVPFHIVVITNVESGWGYIQTGGESSVPIENPESDGGFLYYYKPDYLSLQFITND